MIFNRRCVQLRPDATVLLTHVQAPPPPLVALISRPDALFPISFLSNVLTPPSFSATSSCSRDVESLSRERRSPSLFRVSNVALVSFGRRSLFHDICKSHPRSSSRTNVILRSFNFNCFYMSIYLYTGLFLTSWLRRGAT